MSTKHSHDQLSVKEELFVAAYIANGGHGTKAAIEAGYSTNSAETRASQLLARPRVAKAIEAAKVRITKKYFVTGERIVREMATVAFSDIRHYTVDDDGFVALSAGAPDDAMRAVKRIKRKLRVIPQRVSLENPEGKPIREVETEIELWSKDTELRNLGEYKKLFKENRADDEPEDDGLTSDERRERVMKLLKVALERMKAQKAAKGKRHSYRGAPT